MAAPPQQRAAACGREQAPHRRVDEVAHAGHQHPRYERLGRQHEQAGAKGKLLSRLAEPVCFESDETIEFCISASQNTPKCRNSSKAVIHPPCDLQRGSANELSGMHHCERLPKGKSELTGATEESSRAVRTGKNPAPEIQMQLH